MQVLSSNSYPATTTTPPHHSVTVGCSPRKARNVNSALLGQFNLAGVEPKMRIVEFPVTENAHVEAGPCPRIDVGKELIRRRNYHLGSTLCPGTACGRAGDDVRPLVFVWRDRRLTRCTGSERDSRE